MLYIKTSQLSKLSFTLPETHSHTSYTNKRTLSKLLLFTGNCKFFLSTQVVPIEREKSYLISTHLLPVDFKG